MTAPLFILAPPRSFTSISCAMIGCHPQLYGLAEVNLFIADTVSALLTLFRTRQRLQQGLLRSVSDLAFGEQTEATIEAARLWLADNKDLSTAELFELLGEMADGRGLVDKSPVHVFVPEAMKRMARHFPDARFLHLTRHPTDMLKSLNQIQGELKKAGEETGLHAEGDMTADTADRLWLKPQLAILEFLETIPPERKMRMRGEDLLSDPRNYLTQIAEWLEVDTGADAVEAMMHPENSPFAAYGPKNARYGTDPNFMERPELRPYSYKDRPLEWSTPDGRTVEYSEATRSYAMIFGY